MTNTEHAIREFKDYERELAACDGARREVIRREAEICCALMTYSPDACWDRPDFRTLDEVVGRVMELSS